MRYARHRARQQDDSVAICLECLDAAKAARKPPAAPPLMPCAIHGEVEPLTAMNAHYWQLYLEVVAALAIRDDLSIREGQFALARRLDFAALQGIAATYPVGQPRRFFDAMLLIFEELQE